MQNVCNRVDARNRLGLKVYAPIAFRSLQALLTQSVNRRSNWLLALMGLSLWHQVSALAVGGTTVTGCARTVSTGSMGFTEGQVGVAKEPGVVVGMMRNHLRHLARRIRSRTRITIQLRDALWTIALARPFGPSRGSTMKPAPQLLPAIVAPGRSCGAPTSGWSLLQRWLQRTLLACA